MLLLFHKSFFVTRIVMVLVLIIQDKEVLVRGKVSSVRYGKFSCEVLINGKCEFLFLNTL